MKQKTKTALKVILYMVTCILLLSCKTNGSQEKPIELTVSEGFKNPIGFYSNSPSFSWQLPKEIAFQTAYQLRVASQIELLQDNPDLWDSGKVNSDQTTFVKFQGEPLKSRQKVYWQVKFWDANKKASKWSDVASLELGLLKNSDWKGKWISLPANELNKKDRHKQLLFRPQYMRKQIALKQKVKKARLYITAKGAYEFYINGKKVGDDVMSPGWTPYNKRIPTLTYDVTNLLEEGNNTLGATVAEGWFGGRVNLRYVKKTPEHRPHLLGQLEIETEEGTKTFVTDHTWKVTQNGPIRTSKIYDGEFYDANLELGAWSSNNYNDSKWLKVNSYKILDSIALLPKRFAGVKDMDVISVKSITEPVKGQPIFNFKQNNVGVPLVKVPMKKGDTLRIRFAEMLNPDGTFHRKNYRGARSTDYYVAAKDGMIEWRPKFTFHGYQFIELKGYAPNAIPQKDWVTAIVQHTDFDLNGTFTSSHKKLNKLQNNISWGLRSNFFDVPTDCPQRDERWGWTGDAQVIAPTAIYNADMYAFWAGYAQTLREDQLPNGVIPPVVPNCFRNQKGYAGWGDVGVVVPWEMYFRTGDVSILEDNYDMMMGWLEYYASITKNDLPKGVTIGDWLQPFPEPKENFRHMRRGDTPGTLIAAAYNAYTVELTMKSAEVLGKTEDVKKLKELHTKLKRAFENKFFDKNGRVTSAIETQTQYLMALQYDLLSKEIAQKALVQLKRFIGECDNHLRTGFLGTPILPFALDKMGEVDLMYTILFKETYPSWFHSINQGATTTWERWDSYSKETGFKVEPMNSLNHYAYGAIGQWMYERIGGLKPLKAGYKEIRIAPIPGGPLTSAKASYNTPYGKVSSAWHIKNGEFELQTTIPPNTTAQVEIPKNGKSNLYLNGKKFKTIPDVTLVKETENAFVLKALPGTYTFKVDY
ncbi:glycoside hydrolase family 78 protein [uncultured Polaribacter sp.]|uniref:glycoside hydrolase family 78 protein n=1 Tax=uncultured Polaribacter sp. TaxID=174711 RepID=UPI0026020E6F|nr:glycoside hydrolase family 78 protein [uncultured Polaribacter sp.]